MERAKTSSFLNETTSTRLESSSAVQGVWQEHFVNITKASLTENVGSAVAESLSYVTIPNFGTLEERVTLQESALRQQNLCEDKEGQQGQDCCHHVMGASQVNFNCTRFSVERLLDAPAKAASAKFLNRLLNIIEEDIHLSQIFAGMKFSSPLSELTATWYAEPDDRGVLHPEPKVNIYQEGGYFKKHVDGMQLTLLVVLNDAFEGGGTAFYTARESDVEGNKEENDFYNGDDPYDSWTSPPAGTAIVWGPDLLHMALPVAKGMRAVYVGSFDLNET